MKFLRALSIVMIVLIFAGYVAIYVVMNRQGKQMVLESVKNSLDIDASMDSFRLHFPFNIHIVNFKADNLVLGDLKVSPALFQSIIRGRLVLKRVDIDRLSLALTMTDDGIDTGILQKLVASSKTISFLPNAIVVPEVYAAEAASTSRPFAIQAFHLTDGKVVLLDKTKGRSIEHKFSDISLSIKDIVYPELTRMEVSGKTSGLTLSGWANIADKSMDLAAYFKELSYLAIAQYLPSEWQPEAIGINEALFNVDISAKSVANDLSIYFTLTLEKADFKAENELADPRRMKTVKTVLAILKGGGAKPAYNFVFHTKMDDPRIDSSQMKDNFLGMIDIPRLLMGTVVDTAVKALSDTTGNTTRITSDTIGMALNAAVGAVRSTFKANNGTIVDKTSNIGVNNNGSLLVER